MRSSFVILRVVSFGHRRDDVFAEAIHDYQRRLVKPWALELVDLASGRRSEREPASSVMKREAEALECAGVVLASSWALVVDGRAMDSVAFARRLEREQARPVLNLLIGGADGLAPEVSTGAAARLSLGPMTLPHRLARLVLCEQVYRAQTILRNLPYHK